MKGQQRPPAWVATWVALAAIVGIVGIGAAVIGYRASTPPSPGASEAPPERGRGPAPLPPGRLQVVALAPLESPGLFPGTTVTLISAADAERVGRAVTNEDGFVWFDDVPLEPLLAVARHERLGVAVQAVPADARWRSTHTVLLHLGEGERVEGRVLDEAGRPVEGAHVAVDDAETVLETSADETGRFVIEGLLPRDDLVESYQRILRAEARDRRGASRTVSVSLLGVSVRVSRTEVHPPVLPTLLRQRLERVPLKVQAEGFATWSDRVAVRSPVEVVLGRPDG